MQVLCQCTLNIILDLFHSPLSPLGPASLPRLMDYDSKNAETNEKNNNKNKDNPGLAFCPITSPRMLMGVKKRRLESLRGDDRHT